MARKKETYAEAIGRLEAIVRQIENNEMEIDVLGEKVREANEIVAYCNEKLTKTDEEIEKLLSKETVSE